jgi:hypothetical protein
MDAQQRTSCALAAGGGPQAEDCTASPGNRSEAHARSTAAGETATAIARATAENPASGEQEGGRYRGNRECWAEKPFHWNPSVA